MAGPLPGEMSLSQVCLRGVMARSTQTIFHTPCSLQAFFWGRDRRNPEREEVRMRRDAGCSRQNAPLTLNAIGCSAFQKGSVKRRVIVRE
jgi:hypothetical protein